MAVFRTWDSFSKNFMAVSIKLAALEKGLRASLKGFGVDIRQI